MATASARTSNRSAAGKGAAGRAKAGGKGAPAGRKRKAIEPPATVTVAAVGWDGGQLTLQGRESAEGVWEFRWVRDESEVDETLDPADERDLIQRLHGRSQWIGSLAEALALVRRGPFWMCHPIALHPAFRETMLAETRKHRPDRVEAWKRACDRYAAMWLAAIR